MSIIQDTTTQAGTKKLPISDPLQSNATIVMFTVTASDDKGHKWPCLQVHFAMTLILSNYTKFDNSSSSFNEPIALTMTNKTKISNIRSTCNNIFLWYENDGDDNNSSSHLQYQIDQESKPSINLSFAVEQSKKDYQDLEIFYLQSISAKDLQFPVKSGNETKNEMASSTIVFHKEDAEVNPLANDTDKFTPVEAAISSSYKCYFGFKASGNNENPNGEPNEVLSLKFAKFRMQMNPDFSNKFEKFKDSDSVHWKPTLSCDADISTVLPIIVGCSLIGIVVLTIAGYFIAKRRHRYAYQEL